MTNQGRYLPPTYGEKKMGLVGTILFLIVTIGTIAMVIVAYALL